MCTNFNCTMFVHLAGPIGHQRDVHKVQLYNVCSFGWAICPQRDVHKVQLYNVCSFGGAICPQRDVHKVQLYNVCSFWGGGGAIGPRRDVHKVQLYNVCSFGGANMSSEGCTQSSGVQCLFIWLLVVQCLSLCFLQDLAHRAHMCNVCLFVSYRASEGPVVQCLSICILQGLRGMRKLRESSFLKCLSS